MNTTIHLAHEWDCTKFYMCDHGKRVLRECPLMDAEENKLHFNPVLQVCDWPDKAGCITGEKTTTEGTTIEKTESTHKPTSHKPWTEHPANVSTVSTTLQPSTAQPTEPLKIESTSTQLPTPMTTTQNPTSHNPLTEPLTENTSKSTTPKPSSGRLP